MLSTIRIPLSEIVRCGPHFCSMRMTEDVRRYAAEQKLSGDEAVRVDMEPKAREFT